MADFNKRGIIKGLSEIKPFLKAYAGQNDNNQFVNQWLARYPDLAVKLNTYLSAFSKLRDADALQEPLRDFVSGNVTEFSMMLETYPVFQNFFVKQLDNLYAVGTAWNTEVSIRVDFAEAEKYITLFKQGFGGMFKRDTLDSEKKITLEASRFPKYTHLDINQILSDSAKRITELNNDTTLTVADREFYARIETTYLSELQAFIKLQDQIQAKLAGLKDNDPLVEDYAKLKIKGESKNLIKNIKNKIAELSSIKPKTDDPMVYVGKITTVFRDLNRIATSDYQAADFFRREIFDEYRKLNEDEKQQQAKDYAARLQVLNDPMKLNKLCEERLLNVYTELSTIPTQQLSFYQAQQLKTIELANQDKNYINAYKQVRSLQNTEQIEKRYEVSVQRHFEERPKKLGHFMSESPYTTQFSQLAVQIKNKEITYKAANDRLLSLNYDEDNWLEAIKKTDKKYEASVQLHFEERPKKLGEFMTESPYTPQFNQLAVQIKNKEITYKTANDRLLSLNNDEDKWLKEINRNNKVKVETYMEKLNKDFIDHKIDQTSHAYKDVIRLYQAARRNEASFNDVLKEMKGLDSKVKKELEARANLAALNHYVNENKKNLPPQVVTTVATHSREASTRQISYASALEKSQQLIDAYRSLTNLEQYIKTHQWQVGLQLPFRNTTIREANKEISLPTSVYQQLQVIEQAKAGTLSWTEAEKRVIAIGKEAAKSNDALLSTRKGDTKEYYAKFTKPITDIRAAFPQHAPKLEQSPQRKIIADPNDNPRRRGGPA